MSEEDIQLAFKGVSDENPLLRAIFEVLEQAKEQAVDQAITPELSSEERHYASGMAASLVAVINGIKDMRA